MPVTRLLGALGLAFVSALSAQGPSLKPAARPERITVEQYKFSVKLPQGWFVFSGGDLPAFFNVPAEEMGAQGELPPGGASVTLLVKDSEEAHEEQGVDPISSWANHEVMLRHGVNADPKYIAGPPITGASRVLQMSFDQPAFRLGGPSFRFVVVFWRFKNELFGAELSFIKGDPHAVQHERDLLDIMRSFKPI